MNKEIPLNGAAKEAGRGRGQWREEGAVGVSRVLGGRSVRVWGGGVKDVLHWDGGRGRGGGQHQKESSCSILAKIMKFAF